MTLDFDFGNVAVTEFGVGRDDGSGQTFVVVPVDAGVQRALLEMAQATWDEMQEHTVNPPKYEPSEKHGSTEYLYLPIADDLAASVRDFHKSAALNIDSAALSEPGGVFCYFVRFTDKKQRRLSALRRATQFKGVLRSKNRLVRMIDDTLQVIEDTVFKLDHDFDLLVDKSNVHILRPSGFEFVGMLQQAILAAVSKNVASIQKDLAFIDFAGIEEYARSHPRAARYLASIRVQKGNNNINKDALKSLCAETGVDVSESKGKLVVAQGHVLGFLEVLDRRRYGLELVKGSPEQFRASSRTKING